MPSFTRSGRPSSSFFSSSPAGRTWTALRVRSATVTVLLPDGFEVLDLDRFDVVGELEARDLREEREVGLDGPLHVLRLAKTVALALEGDVRVRNAALLQRLDHRLRL